MRSKNSGEFSGKISFKKRQKISLPFHLLMLELKCKSSKKIPQWLDFIRHKKPTGRSVILSA